MPVYEYNCNSCKQKSSILVRSIGATISPVCPNCGSDDLSRLFSSFAYHKSVSTILEEYGDPDRAGADYYNDPRNIGRWTEKRFQEMGEEVPAGLQEMIHAARDGEMPAPIKDISPGLTEV